jgi:hypothetical protein
MKMELRRKALDKLYKRRDRIEMPDFQREEVWGNDKKRKLIDSILRGWNLPKLYFRKNEDGIFECVDGQQRLIAIWEFYDNKLKLDSDTANKFGGKYYKDLPDDASDAFDDFELHIEEIEDASDRELEDLFLRLQFGTPLNTPEKLNAVGGDLRDFCKWIAEQGFFSKKIALTDTRFAHFDIAVKWTFVEARGIQPQMRFKQLEALLEENRNFSRESDLAKRIKEALKYLDKAFSRKSDKLRNRANVLSVCMLASKVVRYNLHKGTANMFGDFVESFFSNLANEVEKGAKSKEMELLKYQEAITYDSTGGTSLTNRINILSRSLVLKYPILSPLLGSTSFETTATEKAFSEYTDKISELIYAINKKYAADNGEDLFKMTTESIKANKTLSALCHDIEQYGKFIDSLYFLIYEGSGSCTRLPSPTPKFVMDVKILRTMLRHDEDHGSKKEIEKKRKKNSETFKRYSGKKTPSECGSQDFLATQLSILSALKSFLETL